MIIIKIANWLLIGITILISCTAKPEITQITSCTLGFFSEEDFVSFEITFDGTNFSESNELSIIDFQNNEIPVLKSGIIESNKFYLIFDNPSSINIIKSKQFFIKSDSGKIYQVPENLEILNCI